MTFFVQVADDETGEPVYAGPIDADCIEEAIAKAKKLGKARLLGREVRVTHANEITEPAQSWFLKQLAEAAA